VYAFVKEMLTPDNFYTRQTLSYTMSASSPTIYENPQDKARLIWSLHLTFNETEKKEVFPNQRVEVRDNKGVKRFKFNPDYAEHLVAIME